MKRSILSLLLPALTLLTTARGRAGLAEATDFGGTWTSGSVPFSPGSPPSSTEYWVDQTTTTSDGFDAAEGRLGFPDTQTWMQTTVTGPTKLYFSYRAVGFGGGAYASSFYVTSSSGEGAGLVTVGPTYGPPTTTGWGEKALTIPAGNATIRWHLRNDQGRGAGGRVYVDQVWTSDDPRPRITDASTRTGQFGTDFTWEVPLNSATPATLSAIGLPPGLTLDAGSRIISGTPTAAGSFEATLTANNASGQHVPRVVFEVAPGTTTIPEGVDATTLVFTQTGVGTAWDGVTGIGHDGLDSARLGTKRSPSGTENTLSTAFNGPGILNFWFRCEAREAAPHGDRTIMDLYVHIPSSSAQPTAQFTETIWTKATVQLYAGPHTISWRSRWQVITDGSVFPAQRFIYLDEVTFVPDDPEIAVGVEPLNTGISDGAVYSFGNLPVDHITNRTFEIRNIGTVSLTGLAAMIDGPDAAEFTLTSLPAPAIAAPNGITSTTVRFAPTSAGTKTAALHIASNDADESPFDVILTGTALGITAQPVSKVIDQGAAASFSVATNAPGSSFQWSKDGVEIAGAVASELIIPSAQPWHIGNYSVRVTLVGGSVLSDTVSLGLTDVRSETWRGLVACYPFDGTAEDLCRPAKPASLVSTTELVTDVERGGVVHVQGEGFGVPPLFGEPPHGPGGYIHVPKPPLVDGQPFTVAFAIKEEGFSLWHGESFITMGEGATSVELLSHYWIGSLDGVQEYYGGPAGAVEPYNSEYVLDNSAVTLNSPWTGYTLVADGQLLRLYRNGELRGISVYPQSTSGDIFIGRHWWADGANYSTRLRARFDDLRIYNRALTTQDVQQLHPPPTIPPRNFFESWVALHGLSGADAGLSADPDGDRMSNRDEYCFGTSPVNGTEPPVTAMFLGTSLTLQWLQRDGVLYVLTDTVDLVPPWVANPRVPMLSADQSGLPSGYQRMEVDIPVPPPDTPNRKRFFRVEATSGPLIEGGGAVAVVPTSREAMVGGPATFAVTAAGEGLTYQWYKNDSPIVGANSAAHIITTTSTNDTGNYSVVVANSAGSATSHRAFLLVTE